MTKINKLVWRLKESPTTEALRELVKDKILTNDEARQILFSSETVEERDAESLKGEIKFLRELVEKLSNRSQIVEIIREIQTPYKKYDWCNPYTTWMNISNSNGTYTVGTTDFSNIITF